MSKQEQNTTNKEELIRVAPKLLPITAKVILDEVSRYLPEEGSLGSNQFIHNQPKNTVHKYAEEIRSCISEYHYQGYAILLANRGSRILGDILCEIYEKNKDIKNLVNAAEALITEHLSQDIRPDSWNHYTDNSKLCRIAEPFGYTLQFKDMTHEQQLKVTMVNTETQIKTSGPTSFTARILKQSLEHQKEFYQRCYPQDSKAKGGMLPPP